MSTTPTQFHGKYAPLALTLLTCALGLGLAPVARGLVSPSPVERAQFVRGVERMTDGGVAAAIQILEQNQSPEEPFSQREHAIRVLGHLRAEAGVEALMRHLDRHVRIRQRSEVRPRTFGDDFPALQALVDIGSASSTRIVREFHRYSLLSWSDRQKLFWVLYQIEGRQPGGFLIERELAQIEPGPTGDQVRAELLTALAEFEAYQVLFRRY